MSMESSYHTGRGSGNATGGTMEDHDYRSHPYFADSKPNPRHRPQSEGYPPRLHNHNSHLNSGHHKRQPYNHTHRHDNRPANSNFQRHRPFHHHNNKNNNNRYHHQRREEHLRRPQQYSQHQPRYFSNQSPSRPHHISFNSNHDNSLRPRFGESEVFQNPSQNNRSSSWHCDTSSPSNGSPSSHQNSSQKPEVLQKDHCPSQISLAKSSENTMHPKFRRTLVGSASTAPISSAVPPTADAPTVPPSPTDVAEVSATESTFSQASPLSQESSGGSSGRDPADTLDPPSTIARTSDDADKFHLPIMKIAKKADEVVPKKIRLNSELLAKKMAILNRMKVAKEAATDVSHVETQSTAVKTETQPEVVFKDSDEIKEEQQIEEEERCSTGYPAEKYAQLQLPPGDIALVQIGARVAVLWNDDNCYYEAKVRKERPEKKKRFLLKYEDGDKEWINFKKVPFYIMSGGKEPFSHHDWVNDDDWVSGAVDKSNNPESQKETHEKNDKPATNADLDDVLSSKPLENDAKEKPKKSAEAKDLKETISKLNAKEPRKPSPKTNDDVATWEQLYAQFGGGPIPISEKVKLGRRRNRPEAFVAEDSTSAKKKLKSHARETQPTNDEVKGTTEDLMVSSSSEKKRTAERDLLGDARRRKLQKILAREELRATSGQKTKLKKVKLKMPNSCSDGAQSRNLEKACSVTKPTGSVAAAMKPKKVSPAVKPLDGAKCTLGENRRPKSKCGEYAAAAVLGQSTSPNALETSLQSDNGKIRKKDEAKTLTEAEIAQILGEDNLCAGAENWVRRSSRMPNKSALNSPKVKQLLEYLCMNDHPDMVVLKMKKYVPDSATPQIVIDTVLEALADNTNCQSLYIQNYNEGMQDKQMMRLLEILQQPSCNIWCLNIGETYKVKRKTWKKFAKGLRHTKITHMYASEHTITPETKELFRSTIRENRKKHKMHIDPDNLDVIVRCTHCWWNPINAKVLRPYLHAKGYAHILDDKQAQGAKGVLKSDEGI